MVWSGDGRGFDGCTFGVVGAVIVVVMMPF